MGFFKASSVTWFRLGSPLESYRKDEENRRQISPFSSPPFFSCFTSVIISRVDLNETLDWHLADLNPSCLNLCNIAVLGIYQRADISLAV